MNDLYSLSQMIKAHPIYKLKRDELHQIYFQLAKNNNLHAEALLVALKEHFEPLYQAVQKSHGLFKLTSADTQKLVASGVQLLCYGEPLYPSACYLMADPPLTLSFYGKPVWTSQRTLAVVGSREPCFESVQWMEQEFALFCEEERPCIVSGGARGIDQKSHSLAIRKDSSTVVVVPSGLGNLYPENLKDWMTPLLDRGGCVLSEYVFEQRMHKHLFHHRNRLIAALGRATLLVEARRRSGTLITAQQAILLGRSVWVVPGHPRDPHFAGSLDLLSEGASLVRDAKDLSMFFKSEMLQ